MTDAASSSEDDAVQTDVEAEFEDVKWADGGGKTLLRKHYNTLRYGVARALSRLAIPADGDLNEEEMEDVQEYLCDKGLAVALSCEPAMEAVVGRIVRLTTEFEVSAAAEGRRLA